MHETMLGPFIRVLWVINAGLNLFPISQSSLYFLISPAQDTGHLTMKNNDPQDEVNTLRPTTASDTQCLKRISKWLCERKTQEDPEDKAENSGRPRSLGLVRQYSVEQVATQRKFQKSARSPLPVFSEVVICAHM